VSISQPGDMSVNRQRLCLPTGGALCLLEGRVMSIDSQGIAYIGWQGNGLVDGQVSHLLVSGATCPLTAADLVHQCVRL
jgi:hypothetical protein